MYLLQEIKIKNVVIGRQFEKNSNLEEFTKIVNSKGINVVIAEEKMKINIEKDLYFDVLWPAKNLEITKNSINNNALVLKLIFETNNDNNFSMLFTGDIEAEAEKILIQRNKETNYLQADVLKVAHHGSRTSTTEEFLRMVNPKICLIGVGKNNMYGHPSNEVIDRLNGANVKIFRTDNEGEITLEVNKRGRLLVSLKHII